jgi:hypothetical protein
MAYEWWHVYLIPGGAGIFSFSPVIGLHTNTGQSDELGSRRRKPLQVLAG